MSDLQKRQKKIQIKRMHTPRRDFVKEIVSWRPITFYRNGDFISRFPETERIGTIISHKEFDDKRDDLPYKDHIDNL